MNIIPVIQFLEDFYSVICTIRLIVFSHRRAWRLTVICISRSETPLIYKAVPSWFVRVEQATEKLLANNAQTYWYVC